MKLSKVLRNETKKTMTENGQFAVNTTDSKLLDFFALAGSMRSRSENDITTLFAESFKEDPVMTIMCLFYIRDIRGGVGERRTFNICFKHLSIYHPDMARKVLTFIKEYGRWDDYFSTINTPLEKDMFVLIDKQLKEDVATPTPSLLGKWLKSINTSSKESRAIAKRTAKALDLSLEEYRKMCSELRTKINIVEKLISKNKWKDVIFENVPSLALNKYKEAFIRHDEKRWNEYINAVASGEKKINVKNVTPDSIVHEIRTNKNIDEKTLNVMWDNLPTYDIDGNVLVVADTSGSMYDTQNSIDVSVGLAMYFADKNVGEFKDIFMTFSSTPKTQRIKGETIIEKYKSVKSASWGYSTDLFNVFNQLLDFCIDNNVSKDEMPKAIIVISDMEIDVATHNGNLFYDEIKQMYKDEEYSLPNLIFWNVNARNNIFHVDANRPNTQLVSGKAPNTFEMICKNFDKTAYEMAIATIDSPRYQPVKEALKEQS